MEKGSRKAAAEGDWNPLGLERQSLSRSGGCQDPGGDRSLELRAQAIQKRKDMRSGGRGQDRVPGLQPWGGEGRAWGRA